MTPLRYLGLSLAVLCFLAGLAVAFFSTVAGIALVLVGGFAGYAAIPDEVIERA
ncbi:MAG: hypothetical protein M3Y48_05670 [Actinomycetota bacterium]|nr:hypothetical protein [Actinomycetota bacterium]